MPPKFANFVDEKAVPACDKIKKGDVLCKYDDGSLLNKIIFFGQKFKSKASSQSRFTHAAIAYSDDLIVESQGSGLELHSLSQDNTAYSYAVYRLRSKNRELREQAAELAAECYENHKNSGGKKHEYSIKKAAFSLVETKKLEKTRLLVCTNSRAIISGDAPLSLFCSQFVVAMYQAAAADLGQGFVPGLDSSHESFEPSYLQQCLAQNPGSWKSVGKITGSGKH